MDGFSPRKEWDVAPENGEINGFDTYTISMPVSTILVFGFLPSDLPRCRL